MPTAINILMLGWEFPPHIAGGLGTACEGLTSALVNSPDLSIHFIVPGRDPLPLVGACSTKQDTPNLKITRIPSQLTPYHTTSAEELNSAPYAAGLSSLFKEVQCFTEVVVSCASQPDFDIIHAHDWMAFPAAMELQEFTKRPFVAHVHSLEFDRSGVFSDPNIEHIEGKGLRAADRIIAVSHYTKRAIERLYGINSGKITVVHNGVYPRYIVNDYRERRSWPKNVVLFLGRVTAQKGPEHFVRLAAKVVPAIEDPLFVLAGDGDLLQAMRELVKSLGLERHFLFTGFVQGEALEELFSVASLYVMPSVSEPFGIAALEALSFDTPVIVSRNSGVAEVAKSVVQVDLADLDQIAYTVIELLKNSALRCEIVARARVDVAALRWGVAAKKVLGVYADILKAR
jgi:glycogen(starch) synthase